MLTEVSLQRVPREFDNGAGKLDARRAGADDDEGEQHCLPLRIALAFGLFESQQDAASDRRGVLERLQPRREGLPVVMAEIGVTRAGGEHQRIVGKGGTVLQQDAPRSGIDADGRGQKRRDVRAAAQQMPDRPCDFRRGKRGGRHLIEQRLEQMMVALVDDSDADRRPCQTVDGFQTAETGSHHDHMVAGTLDVG